MKTRGIPMTAANAEACALGTKTETRRLIKYLAGLVDVERMTPEEWMAPTETRPAIGGYPKDCALFKFTNSDGEQSGVGLPVPLQPGDFIYIREPWRCVYDFDRYSPSQLVAKFKDVHCGTIRFIGVTYEGTPRDQVDPVVLESLGRYRHARFMPKEFARTWGKVVEVRAERVQKITEEGAKREGVVTVSEGHRYAPNAYKPTDADEFYEHTAVAAFAKLWDRIHGPGSWERNDWVWVYRWEKCERLEEV